MNYFSESRQIMLSLNRCSRVTTKLIEKRYNWAHDYCCETYPQYRVFYILRVDLYNPWLLASESSLNSPQYKTIKREHSIELILGCTCYDKRIGHALEPHLHFLLLTLTESIVSKRSFCYLRTFSVFLEIYSMWVESKA